MDLPERDDRRCKMVESQEAAFELLIPHQQLPKAIEPAMRNLHNLPPGSLRRILPLRIGFLPTPFDVGNVAMLFNDAKRRNAGIARIGVPIEIDVVILTSGNGIRDLGTSSRILGSLSQLSVTA